jgi:hypothetical protein
MRYVPYREVGARPNIVVDGAPLPSTVLTLSHWPNNATPAGYQRETSTETALAWVARHDPGRLAGVVTNNHFDEDGLLAMFAVTAPRAALARRALLAEAARAGDFGTFRARDAARLVFALEAHCDPALSPLPAATFRGQPRARTAALFRALLPRLPRFLDGVPALRRWWEAEDAHLAASEELLAAGRVTIDEEPELDLAIVRIPEGLAPRVTRRYLRREEHAVHPFAIHNATRCARLLRLCGRRIEFQYRYESWLQLPSRRPALRVDLTPFARWLNRREANGAWEWEDTLGLTPRLRMPGGAASSVGPDAFLRELRRQLATLPVAWDPYDWPRGRARA